MDSLQPLVDAHAVLVMEQQLHFADVVGERDYAVDLDTGTITFGTDLSYRAELVGSEAPGPRTWLWSWDNPANFPDHVTAAARALRAYGEEHGITALAAGEVALDDDVSGPRLIVVAVGHASASAFYSAPLDGGGRAYVLVDDPSLRLPAPEVPRTITVLATALEGGYVVDWPAALERYAEQRGLVVAREDGAIRLDGPGFGGHVLIALDELGRVAEITGGAEGAEAGGAGDGAPAKRGLLRRLRGR